MAAPGVPVGPDAPILEVMRTMRAPANARAVPEELIEQLVARRPAAQRIHRDRW